MSALGLPREVELFGRAIGLLDSDGSLNAGWFGDPLGNLEVILSDATQRAALLSLLDALLPPDNPAGVPAAEKWHPLLGANPRGNVYLIARVAGAQVDFGLGGILQSENTTVPAAALQFRLPLVRCGVSIESIAATGEGPLEVSLRVELNWSRDPQAIGLRAIRITGSLAPIGGTRPTSNLVIVLERLDLDGSGARDVTLDPTHLEALGTQALDLVLGLIQQQLQSIADGASGEAARLVRHLRPLLGLDGSIPRFPFDRLTQAPSALQEWFNRLIETGTDTGGIIDWLRALGGLMGAALDVEGGGTSDDPWRVLIMTLEPGPSRLEVTLARRDGPMLDVGLRVSLVPAGLSPSMAVEARTTLASIPLSGAGQAAALPSAEVVLSAHGDAANLVSSTNITVSTLRAGIRWNGADLVPLLELLGVNLGGAAYDRIDLTNTDSVEAAASDAVETALRNALGETGPGARLAALAGLIRPTGDAAWPHSLDAATLVTNPTGAIAALHRAALLDPVHNWSFLLAELAGLLGLAGAVTGAGRRNDPWRVTLAPGPLPVELAAWNEAISGSPADPQLLRIGLRASALRGPMQFWWLAEILAVDLPARGSGNVGLMAGQHASFLLQPLPAVPARAGIAMSAASVGITMDWAPGGAMLLRGVVRDLNVTVDGNTTNVPELAFPPPPGVDVTNPVALGVSVGTLEALFRQLLAHGLNAWAGRPGATLGSLLGLHPLLEALPRDWPLLRDPAGPGSLFSDTPAALRDWLDRVATGVSTADGQPYLPRALSALRALLANGIPPLNRPFRGDELPAGSPGLYEDPFSLSLSRNGARSVELLAWLEPAGPPPAWATPLAESVNAAPNLAALVDVASRVADFVPTLRNALDNVTPSQITDALTQLDRYLTDSDGVVPMGSQVPRGGTWTAGAPFQCAHHLQPSHPSAVTQILAQIEAWQPGAPRVVLLLGPAFGDRAAWDPLLAAAAVATPGRTSRDAHFNLRLPGVDPLTIDLGTTTADADFYTADLQDRGIGDIANLSAQISRLVTRVGQLRPGAPLVIVAHSTAGVAARAFTAANPPRVRGLITLGTPHGGASLLPIRTPVAAQALRWIRAAELSLPAGPLKDAIDHLVEGIDGYRSPASPGDLPLPFPYPVGSFAGTNNTDTSGVPAVALGSTLGRSLVDAVKQALASAASNAAGADTPAPTHIGFGIRASLGLPSSGSDLAAYASLRADAFRVALRSGVAEPAREAHSLLVDITLEHPFGWLVGSPQAHTAIGSPPVDVRLRRAELSARMALDGTGQLVVTPRGLLQDGAFHGPLEPAITLDSPLAAPLLGALFQRLSNPAPLPGSGLDLLLDSLEALGVAVPDPHGGVGLSADALTAITLDGAGFLAPRLRTAFSLPGTVGAFTGPPDGPWTLAVSGLPLEVYASASPAAVGLRTRAGSTLSIGGGAARFDARLELADFRTTLSLTANLGAATLSYGGAGDTLTLAVPPWLDSLTLIPAPPPATLIAAFNAAVPRLMLSSAVTAFFESVIGPGVAVGPIDVLLASPGSTTSGSGALGNGTFLDAGKINRLLQAIGRAIGAPAGPGLMLPGNLRLNASGSDSLTLRLETDPAAPIGGVVSFQLDANIDRLFHLTPSGHLTLETPPETSPRVEVAFGISPGGVTLEVRPQDLGRIRLLPTFEGFGSLLLAGGAALLPRALDELVGTFDTPQPALVVLTLDVAHAFDLYDPVGGFAAPEHTAQLRTLLTDGWSGVQSTQRRQIVTAIVQLLNATSLPRAFSADGNTVVWSSVPGATGATLNITVGWDTEGPTLIVRTTGLRPADAPIGLDFEGGYASRHVVAQAALALRLHGIGVPVEPQLAVTSAGGSFEVNFLPLGRDSGDVLRIEIAPNPGVHPDDVGDGMGRLVQEWLLPLVGNAILTGLDLTTRFLWTGGPSVQGLLQGAGITDDAGNLQGDMPAVGGIITGLMSTLATGATVDITPLLSLSLVSQPGEGGRLGARLSGKVDIPADGITVSIEFGGPAIFGVDRGITVYLFSATGSTIEVDPRLEVVGFGFGLAGKDGAPLVNTAVFRLGGFAALSFFDVDFLDGSRQPRISRTNFGAAALLDRFGIPLGQALGPNTGGNNPVAASLLQSDSGSSGGSGDPNPVNPEVDITVSYRRERFSIQFGGTVALWIPVQRSFGPIYIDQLGVVLVDPSDADGSVALLVDGSVKVAGLTVQADDLGVTIPFRHLASPSEWTLELRGLGVSFQQGAVSIAGGLLKDPGPPVQYVGMLLVNFAGRGITAVGAYARPSDNGDSFTSFFGFASLAFPLGGPPFFFVMGFGGGIGYNRRLLVPEDTGEVGNFLLVSAIDNSNLANDPMGALRSMLASVPPSRGSLWLAAGVKFTCFALIDGVAVLYVALDRGLEIGLLGLARMELPRGVPIVSIELALKVRFSTAEMLLSVQAQLTDNSFIFHRSCRLTGGFALCIWFRTGEFVLTLGGYHPAFAKPAHFPDCPRLGFHWSIGSNITLKGESFFALTTTCVMAGGRLEAAAVFGPVRAWFISYAGFLVSWDPFHYIADIGVSVGVEARLRVCCFACVNLHICVSIGAQLYIEGPPLHGTVTVEVIVISVTIPFGETPRAQDYISWQEFKDKYLIAGDPDDTCIGIHLVDGLVPPEPPGASPAPGTQQQPWKLRAEFSFTTETRMPGDSFVDPRGGLPVQLGLERLDLAPVGHEDVTSSHTFEIKDLADNPVALDSRKWDIEGIVSPFPEATWRLYDLGSVPAAARNIDALSGLTINAVAFLHGQSELIRITGMVDDDESRALPLPFATIDVGLVATFVNIGTAAESLVAGLADTPMAQLIGGAEAVLAGARFAEIRAASRVPERGPSPVALRALRNARSAPPRIEPLSMGLTMKPVGLSDPPEMVKIQPERPVLLREARLRSVFGTKPQVGTGAAVSIRTSATAVSVRNAPRMAPPLQAKEVPGARLHVVAAKGAPRSTAAAVGTRTLRHLELGFWQGERQQAAVQKASKDVLGEGVSLASGVTHVWEVPAEGRRTIILTGQAAARLVFMNGAGVPVQDLEVVVSQLESLDVPANAVSVAILCLGAAPSALRLDKAGFGAVSERAAPAASFAATGWQSGSHLQQVSSCVYLGRGAQVRTNRPRQAVVKKQRSSQGLVLAGQELGDVPLIETRLPVSASVVALLLDRQDPTAADEGDLTIAADGARLITPPVALGTGSRRMLLYDIDERRQDSSWISVTVGSRAGWRLGGVVGLAGRASEWGVRFNGAVPEHLVPDGPLTPNGSVNVRLAIEEVQ